MSAVVGGLQDGVLRADAARNVERILHATRAVYAELGPDVHLEVVAQRAGVGERTLYRRFPSKADLIRAALDQSLAENLAPAIEQALRNPDALRGIEEVVEAATAFGAREHNMLAAARRVDALSNITVSLEEAFDDLLGRAQRAGLVRSDLVTEDLARIVMMLNSVLWTMDAGSVGWRRYVALMIDGISTAPRRQLAAPVPIRYGPVNESWPL